MYLSMHVNYPEHNLRVERGPYGKIHIWYGSSTVHHVMDDKEAIEILHGLVAVLAPRSTFVEQVEA